MANVWVDDNTLKEIADSIRAKAGTEDLMLPSEMKPVIDAIVTNPPLQEKSVTANGEVTADEGYYGLSKVTVNVANSGGGIVGPDINIFENGFTVNFYNVDRTLFETHGALYGYWIGEPLSYPVHHWENENGYMNQFPLTVTEEEALGEKEKVYDLYAVVEGVNAQYLISPNGSDFNTTFLQTDGTPQTGWKDNHGNGGITTNYTENAYKVHFYPTSGSTHWGVNTFNNVINCEGYKYLKVKWLYQSVWYAGSDSGSAHIMLSQNIDASATYKSIQLNDRYTDYNVNYFRSITGDDTWTYEKALNDLENPAWRWTIIDISDLTEFYLTLAGNYNSYYAEIIMCK